MMLLRQNDKRMVKNVQHALIFFLNIFYQVYKNNLSCLRLNLMASQQSREFSKAHRDYRDKFIKRRLGNHLLS